MIATQQAASARLFSARMASRADELDPPMAILPAVFPAPGPWTQRKTYRTTQTTGIPVAPFGNYASQIASDSGSTGVFPATANDRRMTLYPSGGVIGNSTTGFAAPGPILGPRWPSNVMPAPPLVNGDNAVVIVDLVDRIVWDLYGVSFDPATGKWYAKNVACCSLDGNGYGSSTLQRVGVRASGTSFLAGLMLKRELLAAPTFGHMLAMAVGLHTIARGARAPVFAEDDGNSPYTGSWCHMGDVVMINPAFDLSVFTDLGIRQVAATLQTFGAQIVDTCDYVPFTLYGEQGSGFNRNYDNRAQMQLLGQAMRVITA